MWRIVSFAQPWIGSMNLDCSIILIYLLVELLRLNSHSNFIRPMLCAHLWIFWGGQCMCVSTVYVCMGNLIAWSIRQIATNWIILPTILLAMFSLISGLKLFESIYLKPCRFFHQFFLLSTCNLQRIQLIIVQVIDIEWK